MMMSKNKEYTVITQTDVWDIRDREHGGMNTWLEDTRFKKIAEILNHHNPQMIIQPMSLNPFELSNYSKSFSDVQDENDFIIKFIDEKYIDEFIATGIHTSDMNYIRDIEARKADQGDVYEGIMTDGVVRPIDSLSDENNKTFTDEFGNELKRYKHNVWVPGNVSGNNCYTLLDRQGILCAFHISQDLLDSNGCLRPEILKGILDISEERPFISMKRIDFEKSITDSLKKFYRSEVKSIIYQDIKYLSDSDFIMNYKQFRDIIQNNQGYKLFFRKRKKYQNQHEYRVFIESTHKSNLNDRTFKIDWQSNLEKHDFNELKKLRF